MKKIFISVSFVGVYLSAIAQTTNTFPATGNMGVGITSPIGKVEIWGTDSLGTGSRNVQLGVYNSGTFAIDKGGVIGLGASVGTCATTFGAIKGQKENATMDNTSGYLSFFTRVDGSALTDERMRITSAGNIGIGTRSPTAKLHVVGTGSFSTNFSVSGIASNGHTVTLTGANPTAYTSIYGNAFGIPTLVGTNTNQTVTNAATFSITGAAAASTNLAITNSHGIIVNAGAVGSATTNSYGLTVNAQTGATNNYAAAFLGGNVGIGNTFPQYKLQVNGTTNLAGSTYIGTTTIGDTSSYGFLYANRGNTFSETALHNKSAGLMLYANPQTSVYSGWWGASYSPSSAGIISNYNSPLVLGVANEKMRISVDGNVAIGTPTTTGARLTITGTSVDTFAKTNVSDFTGNGIRIIAPEFPPIGKVYSQDAITYQSALNGGGAGIAFGRNGGWDTWMSFYTNPLEGVGKGKMKERMKLSDRGFLGLGTQYPTANLEIIHSGATTYGTAVQLKTDGGKDGPRLAFEAYNANNPKRWNIGMRYNGTSFGIFEDGYSNSFGTERVTILPDGNVGIGTLTPGEKLSVMGNILAQQNNGYIFLNAPDGGIEVGSGNDEYCYIDFKGNNNLNTDFQGRLAYSQSSGFEFLTNGTVPSKFKINSTNGYVGIGTTNPTQMLTVKGYILAEKVIVSALTNSSDWPDYVFKDEYKLRSLPDLETYIKKYSHLPDVPSGIEIHKEGQDIGGLQSALLKKIEELTLYVIEQDKKIEQLNFDVKNLKSKQ